jgi:hypothetical protein
MQPTAANGSGTCLKHYAQVWQIYEPAFLAKLEALFRHVAVGSCALANFVNSHTGRVGRGKASNAPDSVCPSVPSAAAAAGACEDEDAFIEGVR